MSDYDIHSCGYYCDRPLCIKAQRDELRDKLFSEQALKTYSDGKPNYTQPDEALMKRVMDGIPDMPIKVQDDSESPPESWAQSAQVNGIDRWIKANTEHRQWYICPKCSYQAPRFRDEWVGLTDEEIDAAVKSCNTTDTYKYFRAIEAKLKEKNSG